MYWPVLLVILVVLAGLAFAVGRCAPATRGDTAAGPVTAPGLSTG